MPRISFDEADNYNTGSFSNEWFKLPNHKDVATVQFMMSNKEELEVYACHRVSVNGKERYVDCLRDLEDSVDVCPFCASGIPVKVVRFLIMYQHEDQKIKIWERGKAFCDRVLNLCERYGDFTNEVFEIERNGKAGSKDTRYEIFPTSGLTPTNIDDLEYPELLGGIIMDKSAEDMEFYIRNDKFPEENTAPAKNETVTRRGSETTTRRTAEPVARRTAEVEQTAPATVGRRSRARAQEEDVF